MAADCRLALAGDTRRPRNRKPATMFRFTIRDVLWFTVVVGVAVAMGAGWWRDRQALGQVRGWWLEHVEREHSSNPNDYKRLIERERPPFSY